MKTKKQINWIFFDAGGVLIDDTNYEKQRIEFILKTVKKYRPKITKGEILLVKPKASAMLGGLTANIVKLLLKNNNREKQALEKIKQNWKNLKNRRLSFVRPMAKTVIKKLAKKYQLGLLANQPLETKEKLKKAGLLKYFKFKKVSEEYNFKKPDPKFFKAVLKDSGAKAKNSAIADDNIERSLVPAKKLGMTTVWYKLEERKNIPKNSVDFTITSLKDLIKIFDK